MKLALVVLFVFLLSFLWIAGAVETSISVPTGSEYVPGRNYGFQIKVDDISDVSNVIFEWNSATNYTAVNISDVFYYNLTDLKAGDYSYKWYVNNTVDVITFSDSYSVSKNSSVLIVLKLNGTEANKSYKISEIANFTVHLAVPGKTVYLDSSYPGLDLEDSNSMIQSIVNVSTQGFFSITGSWDGDENYTASTRTYYFDNLAPRYSNDIANPVYSSTYSPNGTYSFRIDWFDVNLTEVKFESNFSGSKKNYTTTTTPKIYNDSNVFWINLTDLPAKSIYYKWFAKDSSEMGSNTSKKDYRIYKAYALTMYVPYEEVENGTTTVVNCYSNTEQLDIDDFKLYRNSTQIGNTSSLSRGDITSLPVGAYVYVCNTTGTQNYTNQTINKTLVVLPKGFIEPTVKKEFKISQISSLTINTGESSQGTFNMTSTLDETLTDIQVSLTGVDASWYTIENVPDALLTGGSVIVKINFNIPEDAEAKKYNITIKVTAKTPSATKTATSQMSLIVNYFEPLPNQPPSYSSYMMNSTAAGESVLFSLEVEDDNGLSGFIFSTNNSGAWVNDSWVPLSGTQNVIEVMKNLNPTTGLLIGWKVYVNDTDNEWTSTEEYILTTEEGGSFDYTIIIIVAAVFVSLAIILLVIKIMTRKTKEKKVIYVYSRDQARVCPFFH
jgi:hypothetical protein